MLDIDRKYDWDTREDANTLLRAEQIKKDKARLQKAQSCIKDTVSTMSACAKGSKGSDNTPCRGVNPATIKRL